MLLTTRAFHPILPPDPDVRPDVRPHLRADVGREVRADVKTRVRVRRKIWSFLSEAPRMRAREDESSGIPKECIGISS
eukprot:313337-Amorphochlora_amoeboformis.AAC.1